MTLVLALLLAAAAPSPQEATHPGTEATFSCFLHVVGASPIVASRQAEIAALGLKYVDTPPADLRDRVAQTVPEAWGKPSFAHSAAPGQDIWVIGFAGGNCLVEGSSLALATLKADMLAPLTSPDVPWQPMALSDPDRQRFGLAVTTPGGTVKNIVAEAASVVLPNGGSLAIITFELMPNSGK